MECAAGCLVGRFEGLWGERKSWWCRVLGLSGVTEMGD